MGCFVLTMLIISILHAPQGNETHFDVALWNGLLNTFSVTMHMPEWAWCSKTCMYSSLVGNSSFEYDSTSPDLLSQRGEDRWLIENVFYNKTRGFYLELGALDGLTFSNTAWLSKHADWRGLMIEANPVTYAQLVHNRPNDISINAAICSRSQNVHYIDNQGVGGIWNSWQTISNPFGTPTYLLKIFHL
jgi:hypothetical protein